MAITKKLENKTLPELGALRLLFTGAVGCGCGGLQKAKGQQGLLCRPFVRVRVPDGVVAHPLGPSLAKFFFLFFTRQTTEKLSLLLLFLSWPGFTLECPQLKYSMSN